MMRMFDVNPVRVSPLEQGPGARWVALWIGHIPRFIKETDSSKFLLPQIMIPGPSSTATNGIQARTGYFHADPSCSNLRNLPAVDLQCQWLPLRFGGVSAVTSGQTSRHCVSRSKTRRQI